MILSIIVTGNMSDHSIYLRVSDVYVHENLLSWRSTPPLPMWGSEDSRMVQM